jgi:hypothetical protein
MQTRYHLEGTAMKKYWYTLLASLFLFGTAQAADTGVWYNPDRSGEGINLITRNQTLVLFFYTYRDELHAVPPSVSPAPPAIPQEAPNTTTWYIGQAENWDGESATGYLYAAEAFNYPFAVEFDVGATEAVGKFELVKDGEGWLLEVKYHLNYLVPWHVSLYDVHSFPVPLITK